MSDRIAVFNHGIVQQLDTPQALYERPSNSFVANFIGETNALTGELVGFDGANCIVDVAGHKLISTAVTIAEKGAQTMISVRPERMVLNPEANSTCDNIIPGKVEARIYHGDHVRLRISAMQKNEFILKVPNSETNAGLKEGEGVRLGWSSSDARALDLV
jgi:putative spermidine/putrescine transport system ATP-binding protein